MEDVTDIGGLENDTKDSRTRIFLVNFVLLRPPLLPHDAGLSPTIRRPGRSGVPFVPRRSWGGSLSPEPEPGKVLLCPLYKVRTRALFVRGLLRLVEGQTSHPRVHPPPICRTPRLPTDQDPFPARRDPLGTGWDLTCPEPLPDRFGGELDYFGEPRGSGVRTPVRVWGPRPPRAP